jgi:hypothetical protein
MHYKTTGTMNLEGGIKGEYLLQSQNKKGGSSFQELIHMKNTAESSQESHGTADVGWLHVGMKK